MSEAGGNGTPQVSPQEYELAVKVGDKEGMEAGGGPGAIHFISLHWEEAGEGWGGGAERSGGGSLCKRSSVSLPCWKGLQWMSAEGSAASGQHVGLCWNGVRQCLAGACLLCRRGQGALFALVSVSDRARGIQQGLPKQCNSSWAVYTQCGAWDCPT